jgi:hypothetical protein
VRSRLCLHVSLRILAVAAAYQIGVRNSTAQTSSRDIAAVAGLGWVFTRERGIYSTNAHSDPRSFVGNVFNGPTPVQSESWGGVKARYRVERAPVTRDR